MFAQNIKTIFSRSVSTVVANISQYTLHPGKDLTRSKKIPADKTHYLSGFRRLFLHPK